MRRLLFLLTGVCGLILTAAGSMPGDLHFPKNGFTIAPLEARPTGPSNAVLAMFLPTSEGFAPNVTVLTQTSPMTMDQYIEVSRRQFQAMRWRVVKEQRLDPATATFEYIGESNRHSLHWYVKVSHAGSNFLLATATATENQWKQYEGEMRSCIDSLQRDGG